MVKTYRVPIFAVQVSGEYAMTKAASANGSLEEDRAVLESLTAFKHAAAATVITHCALQASRLLRAYGEAFGGATGIIAISA